MRNRLDLVFIPKILATVLVLSFLATFVFAAERASVAECRVSNAEQVKNERTITVPFHSSPAGLAAFSTKINGQEPFNFVLDTGATFNSVSENVVQKLHLPLRILANPFSVETDGSLPTQISGESIANELEIGNLKLRNVVLRILPASAMSRSSFLSKIDGILGVSFFQDFLVQLDYVNLSATFSDFDRSLSGCDVAVIPFTQGPTGMPIVEGEIDGIPAQLDVDTGSSSSLILYRPFVEKNGLYKLYSRKIPSSKSSLGGVLYTERARAQVLKIGQFEIKKPLIELVSENEKSTDANSASGVIGNDILSRFNVTFDFKRQQVALQKSARFDQVSHYVVLGMYVDLTDGKVSSVTRNGLAERSGLRTGDRIVAIDGKPFKKLNSVEVVSKLQQLPDNKVRLTVRRKDKYLNILFKFEDAL
ncbi:aspartyl protease family protein [Gloeobacter kilaueensis]|uniref:Carboxyl-terminal processing protease,Provisional n=1 Tax=Gloeobacter kilaueensis (strain ATCC BAA-2537 / CCAP 1431/1 / ULC 316 / JS1) TaxID=1183438 RepID=U5QF17_GLOK1|nr:aspartyl protease family protein [Gloeobacter kilaueensis]AGY56285.1 carboxyl-terminal processing protease,Provisional [Gloeobacter kilaueensis JS1]